MNEHLGNPGAPGSGGMPPQFQLSPEILRNASTVRCECGGAVFKELFMIKKLSALISPSGREEIIPINLIICEKCGKVPRAFNLNNIIPEEFLTPKKEE
jgi:hypothetical protein